MANYTKSTNFTAKDALPTGNPSKIIKGSEHDAEYDAIATAIATKLDSTGSAANLTDIPGLIPIETITASTSATIDFDSGIDATYTSYLLLVKGLVPATDDVQLFLRVATSGPTWQAGAGAYQWGAGIVSIGGSFTGDGSSSGGPSTAICINGSATSKVGNSSGEGIDACIRFSAPATTAQRKRFTWTAGFTTAAGNDAHATGTGSYGSTSVIVGVRLLFSSGDISSGSATLYGITT